MKRTMQEIMERAIGEMREALAQEADEGEAGYWDPDAWEEEVIRFTRHLGQRMVQTWAEVRAEQAKAQAPFCPGCGGRRHLHRWQPLRWLSVFGPIEVSAPYLRCPKERPPAAGHRPFQELTGLKCRGKSLALQRALTDFGAEKSLSRPAGNCGNTMEWSCTAAASGKWS